MEDDDGRDYNRNSLHCVPDAKCQGRNLIQRHVRNLIIQVVEDTLSYHPPVRIQNHTFFSKQKLKEKKMAILKKNDYIHKAI